MSSFFIHRPIVAIVIAIVFVIGGAVMMFRLPVAQFPEIVPPQIQTTAMYTGADALTVEQSVATPIDAQVNGAKHMIYMQAINGNDGTMTLQVVVRDRHGHRHRPGAGPEPARAGASRACPPR